jgi:hypothetical protein
MVFMVEGTGRCVSSRGATFPEGGAVQAPYKRIIRSATEKATDRRIRTGIWTPPTFRQLYRRVVALAKNRRAA